VLVPLRRRRVVWSRSSRRVAIEDTTVCREGPCDAKNGWRVVDVGAGKAEQPIDASAVYGFRADGETLVVQRGDAAGLVDWSTKTRNANPVLASVKARAA
jgi:hypothetical protein